MLGKAFRGCGVHCGAAIKHWANLTITLLSMDLSLIHYSLKLPLLCMHKECSALIQSSKLTAKQLISLGILSLQYKSIWGQVFDWKASF